MITLADAAAFFDRTPVLDPDTSAQLCLGQLDPYDDSRRDAGAAYRRVLSVKPGTAMPAARAVRVFGQPWLVGASQVDGLASQHRVKYVLQAANRKVDVYRLTGFVDSASYAAVWAGVEWIKDLKQIEVDSRMPEQCTVFLPLGTAVNPRDVVAYEGSALLVLEVHEEPSGFLSATALRLEYASPLEARLVRRTYAPAAGAFTDAAPVTVNCLPARWQSLFEYRSQADLKFKEGDCSIALPAGTVVATSDRIVLPIQFGEIAWSEPNWWSTIDGVPYTVMAVDQIAGGPVVHARPA